MKKMRQRKNTKKDKTRGFTLAELLIAMMVGSIILAAVATLAGAMSSAKTATDQMGRTGATIMQLQNRLSDLIIRANQVKSTDSTGFKLWHDNNSDGIQTADELTQIQKDASGNCLIIGGSEQYTQCRNVRFAYDQAAPATSFVTIWFDLTDNGDSRTYVVSGALRCGD